jgi:hypothetical protein
MGLAIRSNELVPSRAKLIHMTWSTMLSHRSDMAGSQRGESLNNRYENGQYRGSGKIQEGLQSRALKPGLEVT